MAINPAVYLLSGLNGTNGFQINGEAQYDYSGATVSDAGDINGDGFADIIIGASSASPIGTYTGASYVVFGKADGFGATLELAALDGTNGFQISGAGDFDRSGVSVSSAGDVNNDGFDDIIVGANNADGAFPDTGAAYIIFGKSSAFAADLSLATLDGTNGFKLSGEGTDYNTGSFVSSAGDVNGDGFDDIIIGANGANANGSYSGASYVVFGKSTGFVADSGLSTLDGTNGFQISGELADDRAGIVSSAGDFNGDGFDDLIIGANAADPNGLSSGAAYVVFGRVAGFTGTFELSSLDGTFGFQINGELTQDNSGISVSSAGDFNNDGFDDLIIGANGADPNGDLSGASYIVFGNGGAFTGTFELSSLDGSNGFQISGEAVDARTGISVSAAGDVNGDGFDDVIIGANAASPNGAGSGASYVVFGKASGFAPNLDLSTLDGTTGFQISGEAAGDNAGRAVSSAGDVNGDGFADLLVGANRADPNFDESGATYVVLGRATGNIDRTGTVNADRLFGGDYNDVVRGLAENDVLTTGEGNDVLNGGGRNDTLLAGSGLDFLRGGAGWDVLTGGTDSDWFKFDVGDSGQIAKTMDTITDFEKGLAGVGDRIDFTAALSIGGSSGAATASQASIDATTGVASFYGNSGTGLADALSDIANSFTAGGDAAGDFALFQVNGAGVFHVFISDGVAGVGSGDVLVQLSNITSIGSIDLTGGDLTILT